MNQSSTKYITSNRHQKTSKLNALCVKHSVYMSAKEKGNKTEKGNLRISRRLTKSISVIIIIFIVILACVAFILNSLVLLNLLLF